MAIRIPPPPPPRERAFEPPRVNSVNNQIVHRLRIGGTIFNDRVILSLRQIEDEQYTRLDRPYLIVIPRQVRAPRRISGDDLSFSNPREVLLVAQFDDRMSKDSHLAANDIDTAERQLIYVLANWRPQEWFAPTLYAGMRIQSTRAPDVKVAYSFMFYEQFAVPEVTPEFDIEDIPMALQLGRIGVHVYDPYCCGEQACEPCPPPAPQICVSGGGCRPEEAEEDPCAPGPVEPIVRNRRLIDPAGTTVERTPSAPTQAGR